MFVRVVLWLRSPIVQVSRPQTPERDSVGSHDVRIDRLGCGNQPRVVLADPPSCATLEERAPPCLRQMQALKRDTRTDSQFRFVVVDVSLIGFIVGLVAHRRIEILLSVRIGVRLCVGMLVDLRLEIVIVFVLHLTVSIP